MRETAARLFQQPGAQGRLAGNERDALVTALAAALPPDVRFTPPTPDVGFVHRRLSFADVYFVANTSNVTVRATAAFRVERRSAEVWDPMTGGGLASAPRRAVTPGRSRCRSRSSRTRHGLWCSPIGCPAPRCARPSRGLPAPLSLAENGTSGFPTSRSRAPWSRCGRGPRTRPGATSQVWPPTSRTWPPRQRW